MTNRSILAGIVVAGLVAGCASHPEPIIDERGVDMAKYQQDLEDCSRYAEQISVAEGAARGGAVGAVVGGAVGAIGGNADRGAGYGGITGAAQSGIRNNDEKHRVVRRCLSGRGYKVLN